MMTYERYLDLKMLIVGMKVRRVDGWVDGWGMVLGPWAFGGEVSCCGDGMVDG